MRDEVCRIWEKHVKPHAAANPDHLSYYFCHDEADPDVVSIFELYRDREALGAFLGEAWYPAYLVELSTVVAEPPQVIPANLMWQK